MLSKSEPLAEGTVIMADNQFAGRGQQGNVWHATAGLNLTFSLFLKPVFLPLDKQFYLNMAVSVAVGAVLKEIAGEGIKIKWPNDIYHFDQKIGGILIENTLSGTTIKNSIIGIGLNVNQKIFDPQLAGNASSLSLILQEDVNLLDLLTKLCGKLEACYLKLINGSYEFLRSAYLDNLYKLNTKAIFRADDIRFEGEIQGVSDAGMLLLMSGEGLKEYNFKEIEFVRGGTPS